VHPHVHSQVAGPREGLATRRALVRPLPAVHPHVHSHAPGLREGLAARRALEAFSNLAVSKESGEHELVRQKLVECTKIITPQHSLFNVFHAFILHI